MSAEGFTPDQIEELIHLAGRHFKNLNFTAALAQEKFKSELIALYSDALYGYTFEQLGGAAK